MGVEEDKSKIMRKTITAALIGGTLTTGALALAGTAHPDADDDAAFLAALRVVPVTANTGNEADLLTAGHAACTNFSHGFTSKDMVYNFARLTGSVASASTLISQAQVYLCPQYAGLP